MKLCDKELGISVRQERQSTVRATVRSLQPVKWRTASVPLAPAREGASLVPQYLPDEFLTR